jgi:hypothetical protein
MKLYVCWGVFASPWGHPCHQAHDALLKAGHHPEIVRSYGSAALPGAMNRTRGRREVKRLTGGLSVPVLVTDGGEVISETRRIVSWALEHPAPVTA